MVNKIEATSLSRVFSPAVIKQLATTGSSSNLKKYLSFTQLENDIAESLPLGEIYERAFSCLSMSGVRDDYVYKAAVINKAVLGRRSLHSVSVMNEFRLAKSRADLVIAGARLVGIEVKSDRDSLTRLKDQVTDYQRVCPEVWVFTHPSAIDEVRALLPEEVGLSRLSKRMTIQVVRPAQAVNRNTKPDLLADMLRKDEAERVLNIAGLSVPSLPNTQVRGELREMFGKIPADVLNSVVARVLRDSRSQAYLNEVLSELPPSVRPAAVLSRLSVPQCRTLIRVMSNRI